MNDVQTTPIRFSKTGKDMRINAKLFATLQRDRFESRDFDVPEGSTVRDVIRSIGIPAEQVTLIFINNRHSTLEALLSDGDVLALFPPIGGG